MREEQHPIELRPPGQRIIKTVLSVFIAVSLSHLRSSESVPFFAGIAAVICLQQHVKDSDLMGKNRTLGTVIGGLLGLGYLTVTSSIEMNAYLEYALMTLIIGVFIWVLATFKVKHAITITSIVFLSITLIHGDGSTDPFVIAYTRVIDTMIGVISAVLINRIDFIKLIKRK